MSIQESDVRTLLDLSPICNKIIDLDGKLQYMSMAGICRLKIDNVEEHYGQEYPVSFFPPDVRNDLRNCCRRAINGEHCSIETRALDTEGEEVWFSTTFVPVYDESKQIKFVIAASVDITEEVSYRNNLERKVIERTQEKTELQHHLFQSQKTRAIGSLAAGIAHDFNNVLGMILGTVEMQRFNMEQGNFSIEGLNECLVNIEDAIGRASELSGQLIGFARKGKYDVRPIDVNQLAEELGNLLRIGLKSTQKVVFETDLQAMSYVEADAVQIHQVIQNLVVNSRDALPYGGKILVTTRDVEIENETLAYGDTISTGKYVVISVRDDGIGIDPSILDSIFDPFFSTKSRDSGTGLGLASVWGIVQNHNGYVKVSSEVGKGTEFEIYFRAVDPVDETQESKPSSREQTLASRVLVVDDESVMRNIVKNYLVALGVDVVLASNGEEALRIYRNQEFDLVITDLVMDSMDGLQLFFELKKLNPNANVLLISGYHEDEKIKEAMADGALGFLKKPFQLIELQKAIQKASLIQA